MITNYFVKEAPLHIDRKAIKKLNVNNMEELSELSLLDIRRRRMKVPSKPSNKTSNNIVEKAIGTSTNDILEQLSASSSSFDFDDLPNDEFSDTNFSIEEFDKSVISTEEQESDNTSDNTVALTDEFNEDVTHTDSVDDNTVNFEEDTNANGELNLIPFIRKTYNYNQLIACAKLLYKYGFYFAIDLNNGPIIVSELFSKVDTFMNDKDKSLIRFASINYSVFTKSLNELFNLAISNYDGEVKEFLIAFEKCMK